MKYLPINAIITMWYMDLALGQRKYTYHWKKNLSLLKLNIKKKKSLEAIISFFLLL